MTEAKHAADEPTKPNGVIESALLRICKQLELLATKRGKEAARQRCETLKERIEIERERNAHGH